MMITLIQYLIAVVQLWYIQLYLYNTLKQWSQHKNMLLNFSTEAVCTKRQCVFRQNEFSAQQNKLCQEWFSLSLEPGGLEDQYVNSAKAFHQLYYHLVKGNITIHQDKWNGQLHTEKEIWKFWNSDLTTHRWRFRGWVGACFTHT